MGRYDRLRHLESLSPDRDYVEIYRIHAQWEFPWDVARALELALYRTYAVPSIGTLLDGTGEFRERTQRRYDDTALLLGEVLEHGFDSDRGRTAIRRINRIHARYPIAPDDFRYVLATFVVVPLRWVERFGWRRPVVAEQVATYRYYRELGRHLGVRDIPPSYEATVRFADAYEARTFGSSPGGRRTAEATRELVVSWFPRPLAPLTRSAATALLDQPLLDAFAFDPAPRWLRTAVTAGLRARGRAERFLPPRRRPVLVGDHRTIRSYPEGYRIEDLGPADPAEVGRTRLGSGSSRPGPGSSRPASG